MLETLNCMAVNSLELLIDVKLSFKFIRILSFDKTMEFSSKNFRNIWIDSKANLSERKLTATSV